MTELDKVVIEKPSGAPGSPAAEVTTVKDAISILGQAGKQVFTGTISGVKNKLENKRLAKELAKMIGEGNVPDLSALDDLSPEDRTNVLKDMVLHGRASQSKEIKALGEQVSTLEGQIAGMENTIFDIGTSLNKAIDVIEAMSAQQ